MGRVVLTHPWVTRSSPKFWNFGQSNAHHCSPKITMVGDRRTHKHTPPLLTKNRQQEALVTKFFATDNQPTLCGWRERGASPLIKHPLIKICAKRWSPKYFATDNQLTENYADEEKGVIERPLIKICAKRWSSKYFATNNQPTENYVYEGKGGLLV